MELRLARTKLAIANDFVARHHRHSAPVVGHLASFALWDGGGGGPLFGDRLVGVAIVGRPVARGLDDGTCAEVLRVAVLEGIDCGCSRLYGAARRWARRAGYSSLVTYTRADEPGTSLRASGFRAAAKVAARQWDSPARPSKLREAVPRIRWEIRL